MTVHEITMALKAAARAELSAVNVLELEAARDTEAAHVFADTLAFVRRQALALGCAHNVMQFLSDNPTLAIGADQKKLTDLLAEFGEDEP